MRKYSYDFRLTDESPGSFTLRDGTHIARLDFLDGDVLRVALYDEGARLLPTWTVCPDDATMPAEGRERLSVEGFPMSAPTVKRMADGLSFFMGEITVRLTLPGFSLCYDRKGERLFADRPYVAYNLGGELGEGARHFITAEQGERCFGLGEKAGAVDRFGRSFILGARDPMGYDARTTDPLYKHLPFYICENSAGSYGIYYDTHAAGRFDLGQEIDNYYGRFKAFACEDEALVYYVIFGDIAHISRRFARLCGRCALPPRWSLDYCGSTMAYTEAPDADARLRGFLEKCGEKRIECSGFYMSSGYTSREGRRYVFTWNHEKIPDPEGLCRAFREKGVSLIANIKPVFMTDHPMYAAIAEEGWFLHYADGSPAVMPFWDGWGSYLDFTNPGAAAFWTLMVRAELLERGVSSTWNDNNEYYIADRDVLADGFGQPIPAYRICQVFPLLMVMASRRAQTEAGQSRPMLSTRSGCGGITRLAQTWSGDNRTSFTDLRYNHRMAMGMSLSGIYVFGHDIGGFAGERPEPELFMRWLQYGALLPRFCIHSWNDDESVTEPWMYPELMEAVEGIFALRHRIKPFLYDLLYKAHSEFSPFLAPVFYYFPGYDCESDWFMLGEDLLACCVFEEGTSRVTVRLPETAGGWYLGEEWLAYGEKELGCPITGEPVLLHRAGSVFIEDVSPYMGGEEQVLRLSVYPLETGRFERELFDDDGESDAYRAGDCARLRIIVECDEREVRVRLEQHGRRALTPQLRLVDKAHRSLKV